MKKSLTAVIAASALTCSGAYAIGEIYDPPLPKSSPKVELLPDPWFTGPLLTPSGHVVPKGYINVEPYTFVTITDATYDSGWHAKSIPTIYTANFQFPIFFGLTRKMDFVIGPSASWNQTQGVSTLVVNDFTTQVSYQVLEDTRDNELPGIKFYVQEKFPLGKYERRDPEKLGTDIGGGGSYVTTLGFAITHLFQISGIHFLSARLNGLYKLPTNVSVRGVNAYGGAPNTKGTVKPGHCMSVLAALEYNLTQNWALAFDTFSTYTYKTLFSGKNGTLPNGSKASVGAPASFQFSIAPAIEYNFSEGLGMIGGAWFTLAGKNSSRFYSAVFAINYFGPMPHAREDRYRTSGGGGAP
ncbi:MAG: hypothetical protein KR126chlam1_01167 [Chlamydiae bacterium]|nr:hypothetical protein [Chlamydiota bacterium]